MQAAGFEVTTAESLAAAKTAIQQDPPAYAVLDLKLEDGSGLDITAWAARGSAKLQHRHADRLWQYFATAVAAVKAGAVDYLAKPTGRDEIISALLQQNRCRRRQRIRCLRTGCANISSGFLNNATAMCQKPQGG